MQAENIRSSIPGAQAGTPSRARGVPSWSPEIELRMFSACTYNFWNGAANACVMDEDAAVGAEGEHLFVVSGAPCRIQPANTLPLGATAGASSVTVAPCS